jgi:hypothetical protein
MASPGEAIPSADGAEARIFMEVGDTRSLSSAVSFVSAILGRTIDAPMPDAISGMQSPNVGRTVDALKTIRDFIDASSSIAMLATTTSGDVSGLYVSMFVDDEKFDPLVKSGDGRAVRVEEWAGRGGDAWIMRPSDGASSADVLYVTRVRAGDKSVVSIADDPKSIEEMSQAAANPARRLTVSRKTEGPNFVSVKFDPSLALEELKLGETETSWNVMDDRVAIQWFSDLYSGVASRLASRDFAPSAPPVLGEGELALLASADPSFFIYTMFPNADDPVKSFFGRYGKGIPSQLTEDLEAILNKCRISVAVATKGKSVSTAYLVLDTAAESSLDKLYGIASLLLGSGRQLDGWDSVLSVPTGTSVSALVARRGGTLLLGAGEFEEYGKIAEASGDIVERIASPSSMFGLTAFPNRLMVSEGVIAQALSSGLSGLARDAGSLAAFRDIIDVGKIDRFDLTQSIDGRTDINIFLRK